MLKFGIIQSKVCDNKAVNLDNAVQNIKELANKGAHLVILPEMFNCPYKTSNFPIYAEREEGPSWKKLSETAKETKIYLICGSMPEVDSEGKIYNTSYVFDNNGKQIARHRKMHLFDIDIKGGQKFKESEILSPGNEVTVFDTVFGKIGLAICYDYRFPELARLMVDKGAKVILVPAAFNMTTGPSHWETMFRQRSVDNQVYSLGIAPARDYNGCYVSYGNSIVTSPWGDIIFRMDENEGTAIVDLDMDLVEKVRNELPLLKHRRTDIYNLQKISNFSHLI